MPSSLLEATAGWKNLSRDPPRVWKSFPCCLLVVHHFHQQAGLQCTHVCKQQQHLITTSFVRDFFQDCCHTEEERFLLKTTWNNKVEDREDGLQTPIDGPVFQAYQAVASSMQTPALPTETKSPLLLCYLYLILPVPRPSSPPRRAAGGQWSRLNLSFHKHLLGACLCQALAQKLGRWKDGC